MRESTDGPADEVPDDSPAEGRTGYRSGAGHEGPRHAGSDDGSSSAGFRCDLCGGPMLDRHCRLVCLTCGYQRDCSDP